jgi:threonine synthase
VTFTDTMNPLASSLARTPSARLRALDDPTETYPLDAIVYRSRGGALLEVAHDLDALAALRTPEAWRALFDARGLRSPHPFASGVWSKLELVQPHLEPADIVSLHEGNGHLFDAQRLGATFGLPRLSVKQCGVSHTGSFKDLGMTVLVSTVNAMRRRGAPIRAVACASTGDTSAALAAYGAAAGLPVVVLLPAGKISTAQLLQPIAHGALVASLDTDFDGCMRVVAELTKDPTIYLANSMNSLRVEGQKTLAIEIAQDLDWDVPEWVLVPGGNLGNVSAIAKGFLELHTLGLTARVPRLVCCQAERANPLYRAFDRARAARRPLELGDYEAVVAEPTLASAIQIGAPVSLPKAVRALAATRGLVEQASEAELADAAARADRTGLYTCPHTAVALACAEKLARRGVLREDERVVVVSTAHGLKFSEFKQRYHDGVLPDPAHHANRPVSLGSDPVAVVEALHRALDRLG